jgi:hypothetical protein
MINIIVKGFFDRPLVSINACAKGSSINAEKDCPFGKPHRFSFKSYVMIAVSVFVLFFSRSPFNIARQVSKIIINAFDGVFGCRSRTDIGVEIQERCKPFGIDFNASAPVIRKSMISGIEATLFHFCPRGVFGKITFVMAFILHGVTSWLKVMADNSGWQAGNQFPLFRSYLSQQRYNSVFMVGSQETYG